MLANFDRMRKSFRATFGLLDSIIAGVSYMMKVDEAKEVYQDRSM